MIKATLPNLYGVEKVTVKAILPSKLNGPRLLVQLPNGRYSILIPPKYEITKVVGEDIFISAVSKHNYKLIEGDFVISNQEQLQSFINNQR